MRETTGLRLATVTLLNPDYPWTTFVEKDFEVLRKYCSHITMYGDTSDTALLWAERMNFTFNKGSWIPISTRSLGRAINSMSTSLAGFLDMDVVDTTAIENNVHQLRHNYFSINRELVEDLRDLIATQRRAAHRCRLQKSEGNVYSLLVAPSCVVNP
jgi:hypothetical protein